MKECLSCAMHVHVCMGPVRTGEMSFNQRILKVSLICRSASVLTVFDNDMRSRRSSSTVKVKRSKFFVASVTDTFK
jgi:hypothetical protein